jgi:protein gp37
MGANSKIEWTDHTFNPWIGCTKVSAGCRGCYAEVSTPVRTQRAKGVELWGPHGTRKRTSEAYWKQPLRWNEEARKSGVRRRVFCASLADVFEDRPELVDWRTDLFKLIDATPYLDWLLLTKRPENIDRMWREKDGRGWLDDLRSNVWLGTSAEDQATYDLRRPLLSRVAHLCDTTFLSLEPLLGPIELHGLDPGWWVIAGGESGPKARPMQLQWVRSLRDQCDERGCHFFFKQWGEWGPHPHVGGVVQSGKNVDLVMTAMTKAGKKNTGRLLDGVEHNGIPYQR